MTVKTQRAIHVVKSNQRIRQEQIYLSRKTRKAAKGLKNRQHEDMFLISKFLQTILWWTHRNHFSGYIGLLVDQQIDISCLDISFFLLCWKFMANPTENTKWQRPHFWLQNIHRQAIDIQYRQYVTAVLRKQHRYLCYPMRFGRLTYCQ